jgi:myo-inositol-1-phosphate synthase
MSRHRAKIRIAIAGIGNCAKSLIEGLAFYRSRPSDHVGLRRPTVGQYRVSDVEVVAAFDVDERKVGERLDRAIAAEPNCTAKIGEVPPSSVVVQRGPTLDSLTPELRNSYVIESSAPAANLRDALLSSGAEILVNYLPTGSNDAALAYAFAALDANCSFINCMPAPIMQNEELRYRFVGKGLVLLGNDIKSQFGATVVNRALLELFGRRGTKILRTVQTNYGGNADHFNLQFRARDKEKSKLAALSSALSDHDVEPKVSMIYQHDMGDHKRAVIEISAQIFGHAPVHLEVILSDEDSPNSAGIVVDAIRASRVLRECQSVCLAEQLCPALMKDSLLQTTEEEADRLFDSTLDDARRRFQSQRHAPYQQGRTSPMHQAVDGSRS